MTTTTLKTTAQAIAASNIPAKVIRAVVRRIGRDSIEDVNNHGIDGGFNGFIYTADTVAFFKAHRKDIIQMVLDMASDLGENPVDMVAGFGCLGGRQMPHDMSYSQTVGPDNRKRKREAVLNEYRPSVSRCLYGGRLTDDDDTTANALAWFAAEEVCRAFES